MHYGVSSLQLLLLAIFKAINLTDSYDFRIGVILPSSNDYPFSIPKTKPALLHAVDEIRRRNLLPNDSLVIRYADSKCSEAMGPLAAIDMLVDWRPNIFLGPVCDYAVAPIARYSPYWNIPIITAGAQVSAFLNKRPYSQLTRMLGSYTMVGKFMVKLFNHFNWKVTMLVYSDNHVHRGHGRSDSFFIMEAVYIAMSDAFGKYQKTKQIPYISFDEKAPVPHIVHKDLKALLQFVVLDARIVIICASPDAVRKFMIYAAEVGFANGEYVFLNIDLFGSSKKLMEKPWYRANDTDEQNSKARLGYQSLMTITLKESESEKFKKFSDEVKKKAANETGTNAYGKDEQVNAFVEALHDAVLLYAVALNETLEEGRNATDGTEITRRMWNRTFDGITGAVSIDTNGDRYLDYSLHDMDPVSGKFQIAANYIGSRDEFEIVEGRKIHWGPGNASEPPKDIPVCGFDNSKCNGPKRKGLATWEIVIIVLVIFVLLVIIVAGIIIWRERKTNQSILQKYWKMYWGETQPDGSSVANSTLQDGYEDATGDTIALTGDDKGEIFIHTGSNKDDLVPVKRVDQSKTKQIPIEVKLTRKSSDEDQSYAVEARRLSF